MSTRTLRKAQPLVPRFFYSFPLFAIRRTILPPATKLPTRASARQSQNNQRMEAEVDSAGNQGSDRPGKYSPSSALFFPLSTFLFLSIQHSLAAPRQPDLKLNCNIDTPDRPDVHIVSMARVMLGRSAESYGCCDNNSFVQGYEKGFGAGWSLGYRQALQDGKKQGCAEVEAELKKGVDNSRESTHSGEERRDRSEFYPSFRFVYQVLPKFALWCIIPTRMRN
jgi:hypothetical protein